MLPEIRAARKTLNLPLHPHLTEHNTHCVATALDHALTDMGTCR
ncbi:hypothetical protein ACWEKM_40680 [Streptomyces sp. NPDC004752]